MTRELVSGFVDVQGRGPNLGGGGTVTPLCLICEKGPEAFQGVSIHPGHFLVVRQAYLVVSPAADGPTR